MPLFGLGRADPVARLVRVQPGLDPGGPRRPLPGDPRDHQPRRRRRRARRGADGEAEDRDDRHRHGRQRRDRGSGRDHRSVGLRRALGGADHRRCRRRDRGARRVRDRQADRRPGRRALGARPGGDLGHPGVRPLHRPAPGPVQRLRRSRGRPVVLGQLPAADRPDGRLPGGVHVRVRDQLRDLLPDQEDDRAAGQRRGGGRRAGHLRARDVRLPGAVHPAGGVPGRGDHRGARSGTIHSDARQRCRR